MLLPLPLPSAVVYLLSLMGLMSPEPAPLYRYADDVAHFKAHAAKALPAPLPVPNSTHSFWLHPQSEVNPLADEGSEGEMEKDADICVIGSGITGVSAAYHLSRLVPEKKVVILEAREFCSGATGRNGGHLTPALFLDFAERLLASSNNATEAKKNYALEAHTVSAIIALIKENGWTEDVDLVSGGHISLMLTREEADTARVDWEEARRAGLDVSEAEWIGEDDVSKTYGTRHPAVRIPAHNLWPLKFVTKLFGLAQSTYAQAGGQLHLHTHTPVTSFASSSSSVSTNNTRRWTLTTPRGPLACSTVLHATNAYASHLLPHLARAIVPVRGQVIATRAAVPLATLSKSSWDGNEGFEYWFPRPVSKTGEMPLVILGGGREVQEGEKGAFRFEIGETDDSVVSEVVGHVLRGFLPAVFPGLYDEGKEPEREWTGIMGFTELRDPFVGPVLSSAGNELVGQYISAGYSGHGMPRTFSCAEAIASLITHDLAGRPRADWEAPQWLPQQFLTWNRV